MERHDISYRIARPKGHKEYSRRNHRLNKWLPVTITEQERKQRSTNYRLARRITIASNAFYITLGLILYFLVRVNIPAQAALAVSTETVPCQLQAASSPVSEPVIIDGIITGIPLLNLVEGAWVHAYNNSTSELLDSALTNAAGYYMMSFLFVGMEHAFASQHAVLYPNPASGCQNMNLQVSQAGIYQATITGGDGSTWLREVSLEQGLNQISITGSPEGLNVICLTNGNET